MKPSPKIKALINGILLLNKPKGLTSNAALQKAKYLFGAKKAGHTGSLDPLATGMLPLCYGEATKLSQYLLDADKCYQAVGLLGIKTDTSDATGKILTQVQEFNISNSQLSEVIQQHQGLIKQTPSMFSALKHQGRPLYHYARKGIEIERAAREVSIKQLDLDHYDGQSFSLTITCSKGTYIRNLVEDIGDALEVGAHVTHLHRLYVSSFKERPMWTLEQLEAMSINEKMACLIPMDQILDHLEALVLSDEEVLAIRQGKVISHESGKELLEVRLYDEATQFIGIGQRTFEGALRAKRLLSF